MIEPSHVLAILALMLALVAGWEKSRILLSDWKGGEPVVSAWLTLCLCVGVTVLSVATLIP